MFWFDSVHRNIELEAQEERKEMEYGNKDEESKD